MDFAKLKKNLELRKFAVSHFKTANDAAEYLAKEIKGETVGIGGSITVKELGVYELLEKNNKMLWHWVDPSAREGMKNSTVFLTSANAISETGEIINIDGGGNRVACSIYGPKKVYFVVGINKVCPDLDSAIFRARNVASPMNAKRLNVKTSCVVDGRCHDCLSPERICGVMAIHMRPMINAERTEVVLIDEKLGY